MYENIYNTFNLTEDCATKCKIMVVGLEIPNRNFLYRYVGIRLTLPPRSHNCWAWTLFPKVIWTVKLPESFSLWEIFFESYRYTIQWVLDLHTLLASSCSLQFPSHILPWHLMLSIVIMTLTTVWVSINVRSIVTNIWLGRILSER